MRALPLVVALLSSPALSADYTPWLPNNRQPITSEWVEQAQGQACCKKCTKGQPCGNSCISATSKCKQPPGCAC